MHTLCPFTVDKKGLRDLFEFHFLSVTRSDYLG